MCGYVVGIGRGGAVCEYAVGVGCGRVHSVCGCGILRILRCFKNASTRVAVAGSGAAMPIPASFD